MVAKLVKREVRDPMSFDTALYDAGIDCSIDPDTGEETPSLTKQSFKDECDINNIMRRYAQTGVLEHVALRAPAFGDYTSDLTFQESLNIVIQAEEQFAQLPAEIRDRFGNDPAELLKFVGDEKNRDEAIKLGIVQAPPVPEPPLEVRIVADDAKSSSPPQPKAAEAASGA